MQSTWRFLLHSSLVLLSCLAPLSARANQEITVYLPTQSATHPISVPKFQGINREYLAKLRDILVYDLNHDGVSQVLPYNEAEDRLLNFEDKQRAFDPSAWRALGTTHVVIAKCTQDQISLSLFSVETQTLKHFPPCTLSGHLEQDRRVIHQCADLLHRLLYDKEGVANTRILYCMQRTQTESEKKWISEVWECDWDGANARQITHENSYCVTPVFLPSRHSGSEHFLYVSYKNGQPKIYLESLNPSQKSIGSQTRGERLIDLRGNQLLPAVSAQRDKIAFICDAAGRTDLFLQKFHPQSGKIGKPVQLFSYPGATQASPTFHPDGQTLAFVSDKDSGTRIYTIPTLIGPRRAQARLLTKKNQENSCPSWSPDGKKIAYSAKTKGVRQIWIYDCASGEEIQLTDGPGNKENPAWAPNSSHLIFNSTGSEQSEIYMVNLHQPDVIKITQGSGSKNYPAWGKK